MFVFGSVCPLCDFLMDMRICGDFFCSSLHVMLLLPRLSIKNNTKKMFAAFVSEGFSSINVVASNTKHKKQYTGIKVD